MHRIAIGICNCNYAKDSNVLRTASCESAGTAVKSFLSYIIVVIGVDIGRAYSPKSLVQEAQLVLG